MGVFISHRVEGDDATVMGVFISHRVEGDGYVHLTQGGG